MFVKLCGEWYKLDDFADKHPGGRLVLDSVRGTDATVLFKSLHPFQTTQDMNNMANKYKVPIEQVPKDIINNCPAVPEFLWDTPFQNDLKGLVNGYFESIKAPGQTKRAAAKPSITRKFLLASLFLLRMIVWYYHFTAWSYWTIFVAPAVEWVFSSNIFHDASHSSMSTDPNTNWFLQHVTFFITSPSTWFVQHIIAHHPYTNIAGFDPDLGRPDTHKVISEGKKPYGLVTLFMYWTLAQPVLAFVMDPEAWTKKIYNSIVPIMMNPFNGYFIHYLGRFAIWFLWCGWALFFAPTALHSILWGFVPMVVFSLCFMFCTQLTHMNEVSMGNANQAGAQDWYAHQVITAVNHSLGNPVISICNASLNYQIEHHLFPTVNHCHLPNLQAGVQEICKKHDVPYTISTISECLTKYWDLMVGF